MSLEVLDAGGLVTIQDAGRTGWKQFGVPGSGPMDMLAFHAANALVANLPGCAVLEIGLGDATFRVTQDCVIAVTGAGYQLSVYIWEFPLWSSYFVRAGWKIHLNKIENGMWAYLAVAGGIQTPPILGSRSTYLRGAFGGLSGRQLQAGDMIRTGIPLPATYGFAARVIPEASRPKYNEQPVLDVILGPQTRYFREDSLEIFLSSEYSLSSTFDRMGYRLLGPQLKHRSQTELLSEGMITGAIQVPSNGQPIVMMADGPTTGGYPKIGAIATADLPLLAQCTPNKSRVRFRPVDVAAAQQRYRELINRLNNSIVEAD